jgi:hypothetical protein
MKQETRSIIIVTTLIITISVSIKVYGSEPDRTQSANEAKIAQLIDILGMPQSEEETRKAELNKAIADLSAIGDSVIKPVMDRIQQNDNALLALLQHRTVQVLKAIATTKAQQALLDIALKKDSHWAAINYIETLNNKSDARKLLVSKNPDILFSALHAMRGIELDKELLKKLQLLAQSLDAKVRIQAAGVMGADPTEKYAAEKVDALMGSIKTAEKVKDGHKKLPNPQAIGTVSDDVYFQIIDALTKAKGIDKHLKYKTNSLDGKTRYCVIIAQANRGDSSVKQDLYKIINDPNAGLLKCGAVIAFNYIGASDDLPFLHKIALTDTLAIEPPQRSFGSHDPLQTAIQNNKFYPVRFWARQAIQWIEKKTKSKTN